jgi:glycosyltransferase involved in cell wall biosynthesis
MPLVSVIVPTHNRPEMLREALASVRLQTFTDYEIIVVSNGERSTVASAEAAELYKARFLSLPDGNVSTARNGGIAAAQGEWIAFLDDDDLWLPNKLEHHVRHTDADMTVSGYVAFHPDGREEKHTMQPPPGSILRSLCHGRWTPLPTATMIRRSTLIDVGGFDPSFQSGEEINLWQRVAWRHKIAHVPEILVRYRIGHARLTSRQLSWYREEITHYLKMRRDTPPDLRSEIPSMLTFFRGLVMRHLTPHWLRHPGKWIRRKR